MDAETPTIATPTDTVEEEKNSIEDESEQKRIMQMRGRRASVSAECGLAEEAANYVKVKIDKSPDCYERIKKAVMENFLFTSLTEDQQQDVFDAMAAKSVEAGTTIITQGDAGDYFYVLDTGKAEVFVNGDKVLTYTSGSSFGELALMYNAPRAATVTVTEDSELWAVDRYTFQHILCADKSKKRRQYELFLLQCELFVNMSQEEIHKVADVLHEHVFEKDEVVLTQGDTDYDRMKFYIVEEGEAEAFQAIPGAAAVAVTDENGGEGAKVLPNALVGIMRKGDFFGEKALIQKGPRAASVIAKTRLKVAALDVAAFERLLGPVKDIMQRTIDTYVTADGNSHPAGMAVSAARAISPRNNSKSRLY